MMSLFRTTLTLSAALLGVSLSSNAQAGIWVDLHNSILDITMDDQAVNVVMIQDLGGGKLHVGVAGLGGSFGGITTVFEKDYYFAIDEISGIQVTGSAGEDLIWNDSDIPSVMDGGDGDDLLVGGSNRDVLDGGDGDDELYGFEDNDELNGGIGKDGVHGGAGKDVVDMGRDMFENFQIGGEDPDVFIRYGYQAGSRFRPIRRHVILDQSNYDNLPVVTGTSDFDAADGDTYEDIAI
jgi:Ca2+-binding RTX toxin-like protein